MLSASSGTSSIGGGWSRARDGSATKLYPRASSSDSAGLATRDRLEVGRLGKPNRVDLLRPQRWMHASKPAA